MLGTSPPEKKSEWKNHIGALAHAYNCTQISASGFSPYYLMYGRQPHLPVDITLGLAPHSIMAPTTSKFMQKMCECMRWAHKKAKTSQAKEAQCHKQSYNKRSNAAALEVGDTVVVHVTAFKGHHKTQDQWENRDYVVEKWPYLNVPVYVVCPRDGEGCSQTLHRNYLFPISSNLEQNGKDTLWQELNTQTLQLQHHLWTVSLLTQSYPGWSCQKQQATCPRVVLINLLHLDAVHVQPRTNSHGGTRTLDCWQILAHPASGMHGLVYVFVFILYHACTLFLWEVWCKHTLLIPSHVC